MTITRHKLAVMDLCFKVGLFRRGMLHDLSKYSPAEFLSGVRYYQGNRSPNVAEKLDKGYSGAWLHHKGRNKHHFEYWTDYTAEPGGGYVGVKMPLEYALEMCCDRIAATIVYRGGDFSDSDPWNYYLRRRNEIIIHPATRQLLEEILLTMRDKGMKKALARMRWHLLHPSVYESYPLPKAVPAYSGRSGS